MPLIFWGTVADPLPHFRQPPFLTVGSRHFTPTAFVALAPCSGVGILRAFVSTDLSQR